VRYLAALLLVVGALAAVGFARHEGRVREQHRLGAVASELAGRNVRVHCPSFLAGLVDTHGEAGRVRFDEAGRPTDRTDLAPETCKSLRRLDQVDFTCIDHDDCGFREFGAAWAAHTLAHEAFHLRGFQDEGVAECYALQNTAFVAEHLGVRAALARQLQAWVYTRDYPNEPEEYHSAGCYDGGPLDLRPQSPTWP
jgi:hypothetical protein